MSKNTHRIWEIDLLRGIAFFLMVYDHVIYDLNAIFGIKTYILWGYDHYIGDVSAILFMVLCGISVNLSKNSIKRGSSVFLCSAVLSLVTFVMDSVAGTKMFFIKFGILHFLALAMLIGYFVRKLPCWSVLLLSAGSYALGLFFESVKDIGNELFFLGLHGPRFYSGDYYPLFPNLAFVFLGIAIGKIFYREKKSLFRSAPPDGIFQLAGRHSLLLYMIHQPIVVLILFIIVSICVPGFSLF